MIILNEVLPEMKINFIVIEINYNFRHNIFKLKSKILKVRAYGIDDNIIEIVWERKKVKLNFEDFKFERKIRIEWKWFLAGKCYSRTKYLKDSVAIYEWVYLGSN